MKIVIAEEHLKLYKNSIALAHSIVSIGKIPTPVSSSVLLEAKDNRLRIVVLVEDKFSLALTCPCLVKTEGEVVINANTVQALTKSLSNSSSLTVYSDSSRLYYEVPSLGILAESILNSQSIIKDCDLYGAEDEYELVIEGTSTLNGIIKQASNLGEKEGLVRLTGTKNSLDVYSSYGSGYVRYRDPIPCSIDVDIYLNLQVLKLVPSLGEVIQLSVNKSRTVASLSSDYGEIKLLILKHDSGEYESMDLILNEGVAARLELPTKEMKAALDWQSYKLSGNETLRLSLDKNNLVMKGTAESASLVGLVKVEGALSTVDLPLDGTRKALNSIKVGDTVTLEQRTLKVSGDEVRVVSITPSSRTNGYGVALINEKVTLE